MKYFVLFFLLLINVYALRLEGAELKKAYDSHDLQKIDESIENGANVNARYEDGDTVLMYAARDNRVDVAKILLENGADINVKNNYGHTALMNAVTNNHVDMVKILLENGADVNAREKNLGNTALLIAAETSDIQIGKLLLENGADINTKNDFYGKTALMVATGYKHSEMTKFLLENGADVNAKDNYGNTALMEAVGDTDGEFTKLLLEHEADVNVKNDRGDTPIDYSNPEQRMLLYEFGAGLPKNATFSDVTDYLAANIKTYLGYLLAILIVISVLKYRKIQNKKLIAIQIEKGRYRLKELKNKAERIDTGFFPETKESAAILLEEIEKALAALDNNSESPTVQLDLIDALERRVKELEKSIAALKKEAEEISNKVEEYKKMLRAAIDGADKWVVVLGHFTASDDVVGLIRQIVTLKEDAQKAIDDFENAGSLGAMKDVLGISKDRIEDLKNAIESLRQKVSPLLEELVPYQDISIRIKSLLEKAEKEYRLTTSVNDQDAASLAEAYSRIIVELNEINAGLINRNSRKHPHEYEVVLDQLDLKYNELNREFAAKYRAVAEFKELPDDRAKKEWVLKNGFLSWFFDDAAIAEKFREFDSMEEKLKYLLKANEKLRFMDLMPREGKVSWPIFMQEIRSDMVYDEMKDLMKQWQTDPKFKSFKETWAKKLNESDPEDKKLLSVTTKFTGMKF